MQPYYNSLSLHDALPISGRGRRAGAGIVRLATALSLPERSAARLAAATATAQAGRMRDRPPSSPALAGCYVISLRPVGGHAAIRRAADRSEEHTSELQSLLRISYAVFCVKQTNKIQCSTSRLG